MTNRNACKWCRGYAKPGSYYECLKHLANATGQKCPILRDEFYNQLPFVGGRNEHGVGLEPKKPLLCEDCLNAGHSKSYCPIQDEEGQKAEYRKNLKVIHGIREKLRKNKPSPKKSSKPSLGAIDLSHDSNGNSQPNDGHSYALSLIQRDGGAVLEWVKKAE